VSWESVANLACDPASAVVPATLTPGERAEAKEAAGRYVDDERDRERAKRRSLSSVARRDLEEVSVRFTKQLRELSDGERRAAKERFDLDRRKREADLLAAERVEASRPVLVGYADVVAGVSASAPGYDPDSEH